jgi:hypothetical protein
MGVLIVPILAVIILFKVLGADPATRADPNPAYDDTASHFTALQVTGLGNDWRISAAATRRSGATVTLRMGLVSPSGRFARIAQTDRPVDQMLADELGGTPASTGAEEINGAVWLRYPGRGTDQALVSVRPDFVVLITGTLEPVELRELAASLR